VLHFIGWDESRDEVRKPPEHAGVAGVACIFVVVIFGYEIDYVIAVSIVRVIAHAAATTLISSTATSNTSTTIQH
jgi:hypothetical protein